MLLTLKSWLKKILSISFVLFFLLSIENIASASTGNSCIDCHRKASFQVRNKKLYSYFQDWKQSIHREEGVSCDDCHGGNPKKKDKSRAHGGKIGGTKESRLLNYKNIPKVCGQCHGEIYQGYLKSNHYKYLITRKMELQGPNCVTCHGSINSEALDVNSVETVCLSCHNAETGNSPENPKKARLLLNKLSSIYRFYRFVSLRDDPVKGQKFLYRIDDDMRQLSVDWHSFDLKKIEGKTKQILTLLQGKRTEIKKRKKSE